VTVICAVPPGATTGHETKAEIAESAACKLVNRRAAVVKGLTQRPQTTSDRGHSMCTSKTLDKHKSTTAHFNIICTEIPSRHSGTNAETEGES
jgi:hypothetical protein